MTPSPRRNPVIGIAAATLGVAAGVAAGIAADRAGKHRAAMAALETPELLDIVPDEEHIVLTSDGVALHCEVDVPDPDVAAAAAEGATRRGRPDELPTIVLTHGYCLSLRCWVYQRRALKAAGYRVVSWDQRGHGQSGRGGRDSYTIERLGEDLRSVIDQLVPDRRPHPRRPLDGRHDDARARRAAPVLHRRACLRRRLRRDESPGSRPRQRGSRRHAGAPRARPVSARPCSDP